MNAIRNVREPYSLMKLVRNKKRLYLGLDLPIALILDYSYAKDIPTMIPMLGMQFCLLVFPDMLATKIVGIDIFKEKSDSDLKKLIPQLNQLNISTNFEKILKSEEYEREYKLQKEDGKLPEFQEHKYIMMPCYDLYSGNNNADREVSIHQEHVVGSKQYVLSLGSPTKTVRQPQAKTQFI